MEKILDKNLSEFLVSVLLEHLLISHKQPGLGIGNPNRVVQVLYREFKFAIRNRGYNLNTCHVDKSFLKSKLARTFV